MTRHCHACGWEWSLSGQPGRSETCPQCRADLRVCLNCVHHDRRAAHQCRERRAEPVEEKASANFCDWFDMARRVWSGAGGGDARADAAREALKRLLG
jgi:hypothetical protein